MSFTSICTNELVNSGLLLNLEPECYEYKMVCDLVIYFWFWIYNRNIFLVSVLTALRPHLNAFFTPSPFLFLKTHGVVLPQGFLFLMQQGNPHLDHNDRSSPSARLESECPFLKPCMMGYYECVCAS